MFDEADMLLCGSFQNQVVRLINMFRFDEKLLSRSNSSIVDKPVDSSDTLMQFELEYDEGLQSGGVLEEDEDTDDVADVEVLGEENKAGISKKRDWRRVRKIYKRSKQYIFVAATLPSNGKQTAGGVLKRMFPDASWVSGNYLHHHNPRCHFLSCCLAINHNFISNHAFFNLLPHW